MTLLKIPPAPHLAVEAQRAEGAPLVIFLHGISGNRSNWAEQLPAFADRYTAVAWDARGYGDSDDVEGARDFGDFSADLLRVIDHFGAKSAHLVGLSMGGRIALDFYGRHPERVATLTLADISVAARAIDPVAERAGLDRRIRPLREGKTPREIAPDIVKTLIGPATTSATIDRLTESIAALHVDSYLKTLEAVALYGGYSPFESIAVPCLLIRGQDDQIAKAEMLEALATQIPGAEFRQIPGAGHVSNIEQPALFNGLVLRFLDRYGERPA